MNQDYAFSYMLPVETQKVHKLQEELQFFTEQFMREVRRIVADNIRMQRIGLAPMLAVSIAAKWPYWEMNKSNKICS